MARVWRTTRDPARLLCWLVLGLALAGSGCQTDRRGVQVNLSALARAYRAGLDRKPGRAAAERIVATLPAQQLNDLGVLYEREGRLDRAAWAYQQAVWRDLRFAPAYVNLGNVLRTQGRTEEALFRYRQAMAADETNFEAVNNFADLCGETGTHVEEAVRRLSAAVAKPLPNGAYGLDTLGWLYHLRGDDGKAAEAMRAALQAAGPNDQALRAHIEEHLTTIAQALSRSAEAAGGEVSAKE